MKRTLLTALTAFFAFTSGVVAPAGSAVSTGMMQMQSDDDHCHGC